MTGPDAEPWDILDPEGRPTGRVALRGEPLRKGDRHLVVHVYLVNRRGEFLLQRRSPKKRIRPGAWDVTSGAVLAGEGSREGALREVREELGLCLEPGDLSFVARLTRPDTLVDLWLARTGAEIRGMTMQEDEVEDLRFAAPGELLDTLLRDGGRDGAYREVLERIALAGGR